MNRWKVFRLITLSGWTRWQPWPWVAYRDHAEAGVESHRFATHADALAYAQSRAEEEAA